MRALPHHQTQGHPHKALSTDWLRIKQREDVIMKQTIIAFLFTMEQSWKMCGVVCLLSMLPCHQGEVQFLRGTGPDFPFQQFRQSFCFHIRKSSIRHCWIQSKLARQGRLKEAARFWIQKGKKLCLRVPSACVYEVQEMN